jgi:hypothetical protein
MLLLAKANEIIDFFIMASSQMYAFAYQGALNHGFFLQWQAPKSVRLLATAIAIIGFSYIGKLSNLCFCLPRQTNSLSFPTLGSSQIYAFTRQGKRNCYFCLHWQALKSMLLLARAQKIIEFAYSGKLSNLCLW